MTEDLIHYPVLIDQAMRGVVRDVLKRVQQSGLPGEHHFYVSYSTTYPGVQMSQQLRSRYPKEITIVLQHQFWDFKVEEHAFQVTLSFGGVPEKLVVPFQALTAFADPSIKFGLQFQQGDMDEAGTAEPISELPFAVEASPDAVDDKAEKIISLDAFRKK